MHEPVNYGESVDVVVQTLGRLRMRGVCPPLLFLPDVLVLRPAQATPAQKKGNKKTRKPEREKGDGPGTALDGHAGIGALTAAHLCLSLASEYTVLLAAKVGPQGRDLLAAARNDLRRRGCNVFHSLTVEGADREIETKTDTAKKVWRIIHPAKESNQLLWNELDALHCLAWLEPEKYGLVIGDAESFLVSRDGNRIRELSNNAIATVIDTIAWEASQDQRKQKEAQQQNSDLWAAVVSLVTPQSTTIVSVSDKDAGLLAAAAGLSPSPNGSLRTVAQKLAGALSGGFLVVHGSAENFILSCPDGREQARVPTCDIKPRSTNGAGDTFNGALAVAMTALCLDRRVDDSQSRRVDPDVLHHSVTFATVAVSLRLRNGQYATRSDMLDEAAFLRPNHTTGEQDGLVRPPNVVPDRAGNLASRSHWLSHVLSPFWSTVPKLALIDLDHTLCDSRRWRAAAAVAAFRCLRISKDDQELVSLYENIYEDHDAWKRIIDVNVRYRWRSRELFELALAVHSLLNRREYHERRDDMLSDSDSVKGVLLTIRKNADAQRRVTDAEKAFSGAPAFPYADSIAGLYQLRDILGFRLLLVTEGDSETQDWKLRKLGLHDLFSPSVHAEYAFASNDQINRAFYEATQKSSAEETHVLREARTICEKLRESLKASFRARALKKALGGEETDSIGAYVCTFGDRIDTDVASYVDVRSVDHKTGSKYGGIVIGRLRRGFYAKQTSSGVADTPDFEVTSLPEFVAELSQPGFWRSEPTIKNVQVREKRVTTDDEDLLLEAAMKISYEVAAVIEPLLNADHWDH